MGRLRRLPARRARASRAPSPTPSPAQLGFTADQVDWIGQATFGLAFAPGEKDFDFHLGQVSYLRGAGRRPSTSAIPTTTSSRPSWPWRTTPSTTSPRSRSSRTFQLGAPVTPPASSSLETGRPAEHRVEGLRRHQRRQVRLAERPDRRPRRGHADGVLHPRRRARGLRHARARGRRHRPDHDRDAEEYFGIVLDKDSPLTACVNEALAAVKASGQLPGDLRHLDQRRQRRARRSSSERPGGPSAGGGPPGADRWQ